MSPPSLQRWVVNGWNFSVWWTLYLEVGNWFSNHSNSRHFTHEHTFSLACQKLPWKVSPARSENKPWINVFTHWGSAWGGNLRLSILPKDACASRLQHRRFEPPASGPQPPLRYHNCSTFLWRQIMLPEFCSLWGRNQQGIVERGVCSCLSEDGEAAERSRQEPGSSFTSGLSGQFPASPLPTSCLSVTLWLECGMTLSPHVYTWDTLLRFMSDTFCTWRRACYPSYRPGRALESYGSSAKRPSLFLS